MVIATNLLISPSADMKTVVKVSCSNPRRYAVTGGNLVTCNSDWGWPSQIKCEKCGMKLHLIFLYNYRYYIIKTKWDLSFIYRAN